MSSLNLEISDYIIIVIKLIHGFNRFFCLPLKLKEQIPVTFYSLKS